MDVTTKCRCQVAPSFDVLRVVCDGTTSTNPKVDGAVRDPPVSSADESTGGGHDDVVVVEQWLISCGSSPSESKDSAGRGPLFRPVDS